jgi:hypothetical protein
MQPSRFIPCVVALLLFTAGCSAARATGDLEARLAAGDRPPVDAPAPAPLTENHFQRDRAGPLTEAQLRQLLDAPVVLQPGARVGIVPVASGYHVDGRLPLDGLTAALGAALEDTGLFEVASEVSTDWPATRQIAGLRELAARYRCEYLLLYRHRFVEASFANPWAWTYLTGIGVFVAPARTLEVRGVVEATLFDVRTGTILVTVFERVAGSQASTNPARTRNQRALEARLLAEAVEPLGTELVEKIQRIAAAGEAARAPTGSLSGS